MVGKTGANFLSDCVVAAYEISHFMRNFSCHVEQQSADQSVHLCGLIKGFIVHCLVSKHNTFYCILSFKISYLVSVPKQAG